eukprot:CFRG7919T1
MYHQQGPSQNQGGPPDQGPPHEGPPRAPVRQGGPGSPGDSNNSDRMELHVGWQDSNHGNHPSQQQGGRLPQHQQQQPPQQRGIRPVYQSQSGPGQSQPMQQQPLQKSKKKGPSGPGPTIGGKPIVQQAQQSGSLLHHHVDRPTQVVPRQQPPPSQQQGGHGHPSHPQQPLPPHPLLHRPSPPAATQSQPPQQQQGQQQPPPQPLSGAQSRLKVEDAISYLDNVKKQFGDNLHVYNQFLDIMKEFKSQGIDTPGVIGRVSSLFEGHPKLVKGFNTFLPPGYKIDYAPGQSYGPPSVTLNSQPIGIPDYHPRSQRPPLNNAQQQHQQQLQGQGVGQGGGQSVPQGGSNQAPMRPHHMQQQSQSSHGQGKVQQPQQRHPNEKVSSTSTTHMSVASVGAGGGGSGGGGGGGSMQGQGPPHTQQGVPIMPPMPQPNQQSQQQSQHSQIVGGGGNGMSVGGGGSGMSVGGGGGLVAPQHPAVNPHAIQPPPVEFNSAINYVNKIKTRFGQSPDVYKHFLEILHTYQKEQRTIKEVYQQVANLFRYHPDLLSEFSQFLPEAAPLSAQQDSSMNVSAAGQLSGNLGGGASVGMSTSDGKIGRGGGAVGGSIVRGGGARRGKRKDNYANSEISVVPTGTGATTGLNKRTKTEKAYAAVSSGVASGGGVASTGGVASAGSVAGAGGVAGANILKGHGQQPPMSMPQTKAYSGERTGVSHGHSHHGFDDMAFFDAVKRHLKSKVVYENFLRTLNLYTQDLLDRYELVTHVEKYIGRFPNLMERFRVIVDVGGVGGGGVSVSGAGCLEENSGDEGSDGYGGRRIGQVQRINGNLLDYSVYKRFGHSYRALPKIYQKDVCTGRSADDAEVLNDEWVLFPVSVESDTFVPASKNSYEYALYKCEDERYELDMLLEMNASTLQVLEKVEDRISKMSAEEGDRFRLDGRLGGQSTTIHYTSLKRLYAERVKDVIDGLKKNPKHTIPVVLRRLRSKEKDWRTASIEWNRGWGQIHEKSMLKSLDYRSVLSVFAKKDRDTLTPEKLVSAVMAEVEFENLNRKYLIQNIDEGVSGVSDGSDERTRICTPVHEHTRTDEVDDAKGDGGYFRVNMGDGDILSDIEALVNTCMDPENESAIKTTGNASVNKLITTGANARGNSTNMKAFKDISSSDRAAAMKFLKTVVLRILRTEKEIDPIKAETSTLNPVTKPQSSSSNDPISNTPEPTKSPVAVPTSASHSEAVMIEGVNVRNTAVIYCDSTWLSVWRLVQVLYQRLAEAKRQCELTVTSTHTERVGVVRVYTSNYGDNAKAPEQASTTSVPNMLVNGGFPVAVGANGSEGKSSTPTTMSASTAKSTSRTSTPTPVPTQTLASPRSNSASTFSSTTNGEYGIGEVDMSAERLYVSVMNKAKEFVTGTMDHTLFEDYVRNLIGVGAFELYSLDKSVQTLCTQLVTAVQCTRYTSLVSSLSAYETQRSDKEDPKSLCNVLESYRRKVDKSLDKEESLFRIYFCLDSKMSNVSAVRKGSVVTLQTSVSSISNEEFSVNRAEDHIHSSSIRRVPPVYLARSIDQSFTAASEGQQFPQQNCISLNNIVTRFCLKTMKMVYVRNTFDFSVRPDRVKSAHTRTRTGTGIHSHPHMWGDGGSGRRSGTAKDKGVLFPTISHIPTTPKHKLKEVFGAWANANIQEGASLAGVNVGVSESVRRSGSDGRKITANTTPNSHTIMALLAAPSRTTTTAPIPMSVPLPTPTTANVSDRARVPTEKAHMGAIPSHTIAADAGSEDELELDEEEDEDGED